MEWVKTWMHFNAVKFIELSELERDAYISNQPNLAAVCAVAVDLMFDRRELECETENAVHLLKQDLYAAEALAQDLFSKHADLLEQLLSLEIDRD